MLKHIALVAGLCAMVLATPLSAAVIDFETTAVGGVVTDDLIATGTFVDGTTLVTFGFDTTADNVIDYPAYFEDLGAENPELLFAYAHGSGTDGDDSIKDTDDSTGLEGGSFLVRRPFESEEAVVIDLHTDPFCIVYSGVLPFNATGQIWDIDAGEQYRVDALNSGGAVIASITSPVGLLEETVNSLSGLPWDFTFLFLPQAISSMRIQQIDAGPARGFAFDNFDATGSNIEGVPEPTTLALLGLGLLAARRRRKH
ncbi:PEP-CTERM sorting domain-containing protein [bacterium]|nr:PEP-CTERM sorting domain-containing protein [bacterium]